MPKITCKMIKETLLNSGCNVKQNRVWKSGSYGTMIDLYGLPDWKQLECLRALDENGIGAWQPDPVHCPSDYKLVWN